MTDSTQGSTTGVLAEAKVHSRFGPKAAKLLNKVDRKLYQISARQGRAHLLYLVEARLYAWLCRQAWFQSRYQAHEVRQIQRFLDETAILKLNPALNAKQVIQQALLGNYLRWRWRQRFNSAQSPITTLFTVQGQEILEAAVQQKKGVILTFAHSYAVYLVRHWLLASRQEPEVTILNASNAAHSMGVPFSPATSHLIHTRQLYQAKECLQRNGIVSIAADGLDGHKTLVLPLYQYPYPFRTTFARLALRTGAVVLPVSARLDLHGRVGLIFHSALHPGADEEPRQQRMEQLIKQYAAFLHAEWAASPGNIPSRFMERHLLGLPQLDEIAV